MTNIKLNYPFNPLHYHYSLMHLYRYLNRSLYFRDYSDWKCSDCVEDTHPCQVCNSREKSPENPIFRCNTASCGRFFHQRSV